MFIKVMENPFWNIFLLAIAWALTLTTSTLLTTIGPLSAKQLGASDSFAAFTIGTFLIGAAVSSVPSGLLFRKYGRFLGFSVGCMCQIIGSIFGSFAIASKDITSLYIGCFFIGLGFFFIYPFFFTVHHIILFKGQGLGQFYRFSAVEITPPELKSRAVTYVLSGGILAAFAGPTSATYSMNIFSQTYQVKQN
jgi:MFS family permease